MITDEGFDLPIVLMRLKCMIETSIVSFSMESRQIWAMRGSVRWNVAWIQNVWTERDSTPYPFSSGLYGHWASHMKTEIGSSRTAGPFGQTSWLNFEFKFPWGKHLCFIRYWDYECCVDWAFQYMDWIWWMVGYFWRQGARDEAECRSLLNWKAPPSSTKMLVSSNNTRNSMNVAASHLQKDLKGNSE